MRSSVPRYIRPAEQGRPVTAEMPSVNASSQAGPDKPRSLRGSGRRAAGVSLVAALTSATASGGAPCTAPSGAPLPLSASGSRESDPDPEPEGEREEESESESEVTRDTPRAERVWSRVTA